jgi:cytochrome P450 PksS
MKWMNKIAMGDFYSPETMRDPFAFYSRLREQQEPLFHLDDVYGMGGAWVALRYDDVVEILKDPRFVKDMRKFLPSQDKQESSGDSTSKGSFLAWWMNMPNMLTVDPPDHTRLRRLASKAFTPRMIEELRPRIQQITDELIDAVQGQGHMDLIADFAYPLPIIVISEILGIPSADRDQFRDWTESLMKSVMDPQRETSAIATLEAFVHYIKTLVAEKREHPGNDLTSGLVQTYEEGDVLSENELLSTIWLLITAGHETTVNLIGNGVLALLQHSDQLQLLQNDPSLLPSAIEELLRYAGPVMVGNRFADEDISMNGKVIRKGEMVLFSLTAASIDPQQFSNPEVLDITREENQHLAFGKGIHYCMGAPLARMEGQIAIGTLLHRIPTLRLASNPDQLTWSYSKFRALASLSVTF